jgi:hypothetical protein
MRPRFYRRTETTFASGVYENVRVSGLVTTTGDNQDDFKKLSFRTLIILSV